MQQMVTKLQLMISQKEELISKYEGLLKEGKDAHSLAAIRFQDEIKQLQNQLQIQQTAYQEYVTYSNLHSLFSSTFHLKSHNYFHHLLFNTFIIIQLISHKYFVAKYKFDTKM